MNGAVVCGIRRYPVKSLGGEALDSAELIPGRGVAFDRRWGLAVADLSPLLQGAEKWRPWNFCLSLKRREALAELRASVIGLEAGGKESENGREAVLEIASASGGRARGRPGTTTERTALENFLRRELDDARIVLAESEASPLWDGRGVSLSVLNLASARALSERMNLRGAEALSAERFRANLIIDGIPAWTEMSWARRRFATGKDGAGERVGAVLRMTDSTPRCAATQVNPETGVRDADVLSALVSHFGHSDLGIYAEATQQGEARTGDAFFEFFPPTD